MWAECAGAGLGRGRVMRRCLLKRDGEFREGFSVL